MSTIQLPVDGGNVRRADQYGVLTGVTSAGSFVPLATDPTGAITISSGPPSTVAPDASMLVRSPVFMPMAGVNPQGNSVLMRCDQYGNLLVGNPLRVGSTLFVDSAYGNDATGMRERADRPFISIASAIAAAVSGDTIQLRGGTYTVTNIILPSNVSLSGAGMMNTIVQSASGTGCVVVPGNNSLIRDLTIQATAVWPVATYPLGSLLPQPAFTGAIFSNLRILGDTDGIFVSTPACSFRAFNCIISTFWDLVVLNSGTADLYNCELTSVASASTWIGHASVNSHGISGTVSGGRARLYGGRINCSGSVAGNVALLAASGFVIEAYGVVSNVIAGSGTALDADASGGFPTASIRIANLTRQDGAALATNGSIIQLAPPFIPPSSDPHVIGAIWWNGTAFVRSAG